MNSRRVVITGVGAITPLGLTAEETWKAALQGKNAIGPITRFDAQAYPVRFAGEVKNFDPDPFIPKKEQKRMEFFVQYAVASTAMALKDANFTITPENAERVGALIGVGIGGLATIEENHQKIIDGKINRVSPFFIPIVISNMASGHVTMAFGLKGPSFAVTSACASGANAIGEAVAMIQSGRARAMIAGGAESTICGLAIAGFAAMRALSERNDDPATASRPFDATRDGFVLSEGAAVFVLESLEDAEKRGARILCEVTGYGASSDAYHMTSPAPDHAGAQLAMRNCFAASGIKPEDVQYLNAHGTSTSIGDELECIAIEKVFGDSAKKLWVSSTKSMMGHSLGAAGAIESLFCIYALRDQLVPPTINLKTADPKCALDFVPNRARDGRLKNVLNNSFGFGGANACLMFSKL